MQLLDPSLAWELAFLDMARECAAAGERRYAPALHDFGAYVRMIESERTVERTPDGRIAGTHFWFEDGGTIVACARLRFWLTAAQEREGGHIGYDVRPSRRRQGYGTAVLALTLAKARARDIRRVLVTCDFDNAGSIKVIERNGGTFAGENISAESGKLVRRYWIDQ